VIVVDGETVRFQLPPLAEGNHNVQIAAGALQDVQGTPIEAFSMTFYEDVTSPRVASSSIQEGDVLPIGDLTYTVQFSEPMQTANFDPFDFVLQGTAINNVVYSPTTFGFDGTSTILTLSFTNLPEDSYTLTLFSGDGAFEDLVGFDLDGEPLAFPIPPNQSGDGVEGGNFVVNFDLDIATAAYPTPLAVKAPLGSLVYDPSVTLLIHPSGDTDQLTIELDPGQTITVVVDPATGLQPTIELRDPAAVLLGTASAAGPGQDAVLQTVAVTTAGTYAIVVSGAAGTTGVYTAQVVLNAAVEVESHDGPLNDTLTDAQSLSAAFIELAAGADRAAVLGRAEASEVVINGSFETGDFSGWTVQTIGVPFVDWMVSQAGAGSGFLIPTSPQDGLYDAWNGFDGGGPMEFAMYQDVTIPASATTPSLSWQERIQWDFVLTSTATLPRTYDVQIVDPATSTVLETLYSFSTGIEHIIGDTGWQTHVADLTAYVGQTIRLLFHEFIPESFTGPGQIEFDTIKIEGIPQTDDYYSFDLVAGQTATVVLADLVSSGVAIELLDPDGTVVASGLGGAPAPENVDDLIANYLATESGTYYVRVLGGVAHDYNLIVTRDAAFDIESNDAQELAQPLDGNDAALGMVLNESVVSVGTVFEGLNGSESGGFIPPDTILAVGPDHIVEGTNVAIRITDKAGNNLSTQFLSDFFAPLGVPSAGDPYVVYDEIASRWYVISIDGFEINNLLLAVSNDSNPLNGFSEMHRVGITPPGDLADFPKLGFNADAVVLSVNDFGAGGGNPALATIDKSTLLDQDSNTIDVFYSTPAPNFRAMVPAQMHGALPGGPMYFIQERQYVDGSAIQAVTMTNYLSNTPTFVYTDIPVEPYGFPPGAQQPGGSSVVNDTTFTQLDWRDGKMVAGHTIGVSNDNASKVRWYQIDTTGASPSLIQQGTIDPGPGISTYFGSIAQDADGNLGATYMQSSANEFISMYVAGKAAGTPLGVMGAGEVVAIGTAFNFFSQFRNGDYSGLVVDPTDGTTFWAANEYAGSDPVWNTKIASFQVELDKDSDWYDVEVAGGSSLTLVATVPADGPGQFVNNLVPRIELYDAGGNLLGSVEGAGVVLATGPLTAGTYSVRIQSAGDLGGEYVLSVESSGGAAPLPALAGLPVPGDANRDGVFDSADFVQFFQAGEYEDSIPDNSTSAEGDWNGDGDFDTRDLVYLFQNGKYVNRTIIKVADSAFATDVLDGDAWECTTVDDLVKSLEADVRSLHV
jgi:hypothetical protein